MSPSLCCRFELRVQKAEIKKASTDNYRNKGETDTEGRLNWFKIEKIWIDHCVNFNINTLQWNLLTTQGEERYESCLVGFSLFFFSLYLRWCLHFLFPCCPVEKAWSSAPRCCNLQQLSFIWDGSSNQACSAGVVLWLHAVDTSALHFSSYYVDWPLTDQIHTTAMPTIQQCMSDLICDYEHRWG